MKVAQNNLVSIIVRTCNPSNYYLLKLAIESIIINYYRPIQIIIVIQTESIDYYQNVLLLISKYKQSQILFSIVLNSTSHDERAKNLNLGLQDAEGQYIGFLDDDDILYSNHINTLLSKLKESNYHAWAYTDFYSTICDFNQQQTVNVISQSSPNHTKNQFSLSKLCQNGYIAIHSYLIDRKKVEPNLLCFDESLSVLEDYELMLRLSQKYEPIYIPVITCEYRQYVDARNSNYFINQTLGIEYSQKAKIWWSSYKQVEEKKKQLFDNYRPNFFSYAMRSYLMSKFPFLYPIRRIWKMLKKLIHQ